MIAADFAGHDVLFIRLASQIETTHGVAAQIDARRRGLRAVPRPLCADSCAATRLDVTALRRHGFGDPLVIRMFNS
jgi:hypothetical protein